MRYGTDLTDRQRGIIRDILPKENRGKHLQCHSKRELINAVLYLNKTGYQWRLLPKDFPIVNQLQMWPKFRPTPPAIAEFWQMVLKLILYNYETVSSFYQRAEKSGLWGKMMNALVKKTRKKSKQKESPSYAINDSQNVKTAYKIEERGIDGNKKIKGRKQRPEDTGAAKPSFRQRRKS